MSKEPDSPDLSGSHNPSKLPAARGSQVPVEPAIHAAARVGDLVALERLLREGHDINGWADVLGERGDGLRRLTPLMVAARSMDGATANTLRWLVANGADPRAQSESGETSAFYAAGNGGRSSSHPREFDNDYVDRLSVLLGAGVDCNEESVTGTSLICVAASTGDPARVRLLLNAGARPNPGDGIAQADPMDAIRKLLIEAGIDLDQVRRMIPQHGGNQPAEVGPFSYIIPLFLAAESGSAQCIDLLLEAGANLTQRDSQGHSALMHAASPEAVRALIKAGASISDQSKFEGDVLAVVMSSEGPFVGGSSGDRFAVARELIANGARLDEAANEFGLGRLHSAASSHQADTVDFLLGLGLPASTPGNSALHGICWQGEYVDWEKSANCARIIRSLVKAGADVNQVDERGRTPLHQAVGGDWGNVTAVRTLIELSALVDIPDSEGNAPLFYAARRAEHECITALLSAGANPKQTNSYGQTALDPATEHLQSWIAIVASPPDLGLIPISPEDQRSLNQDQLDKARRCVATLQSAIQS